jgi:hypothetical protein
LRLVGSFADILVPMLFKLAQIEAAAHLRPFNNQAQNVAPLPRFS